MITEVEKEVLQSRVIAIMRGNSTDTCLKLVEAFVKGGIRMVEVTFVQTDRSLWKVTADSIAAIGSHFGGEVHVGAGTVLTSEQLHLTRDAGGEFMVAPNVNAALIAECRELGLAPIPGAFTASEVVTAWEAGASFVKVFPAGNFGPAYFKALKTPLAHIPMLAVGGITPDNAEAFIKAGAVGVAVSGALTDRRLIEAGDWNRITEIARTLRERTS